MAFDTLEIRGYLKSPSNTLCVGSTGSGKTTLCLQLLLHLDSIYDHKIAAVALFYKIDQPIYEEFRKIGVEMMQFIPTEIEIKNWCSKYHDQHTLIIFDDLAHEMLNKEFLQSTEGIFTRIGHHCSTNILFLSQNLFWKNMRMLSLNSHYFILLPAVRDKRQIITFASQMFPGDTKKFLSIFKDALIESSNFDNIPPYLLIKAHVYDSRYQFFTRILPQQYPAVMYIMN